MTIIWTTKGRESLREIREYISQYSQSRANNLIKELIEKVDILAQNPNAGQSAPEISHENVRGLIHENYRILYLVDDKVYIFRVIHTRQDFKKLNIKPDV